jgi:sugar phosphate permease
VSSQPIQARPGPPSAARSPALGEQAVVWVLWLTYGSFYFCRTNIAAAVPGLQADLHLDKAQIGQILAILKVTYGTGQLINGQLAERLSPRVLLATGMLGSALLNLLFGFGAGFYFLLFVWATNGYCQSLGWTPTVRVIANWVPPVRRGRAIGILGTGYQVVGALTVLLAGWAAEHLGWRGAFYLPAALLTAAAIFMLCFLRESPPPLTPPAEAAEAVGPAPPRGTFRQNLAATLSNPALWLLAISLALLDACRYGFMDWGLTHLKEVQGARVDVAALKISVLPLGGIAGSYLAGWASDRFFGGRRAPVICGLLVALGLLTLLYDRVVPVSRTGSVVLLVFIGFAIFGPQLLLVGTAPADLARRGAAAAAAGFVNFMGYMGAAAGDQVTGRLVQQRGWSAALALWAGCAFGAAVSAAFLWNVTAAPRPAVVELGEPENGAAR